MNSVENDLVKMADIVYYVTIIKNKKPPYSCVLKN